MRPSVIVTRSRRASIGWLAGLAGLVGLATGCGADDDPKIRLATAASWNRDPARLADIGYQVDVDLGWPDRVQTCFALPADLKVTLDDREMVPDPVGDCEWDLHVTFNAIDPTVPFTVRVKSGARMLGEATYAGLFPGHDAQLLVPADGKLRVGEAATVTLPATEMPVTSDLFSGKFYWLDSPATVPPYNTFSPGAAGTDPGTVTIMAPAATGRALLVVSSVFKTIDVMATSCTGFWYCTANPDSATLGPFPIEVLPAPTP